MTVVRMIMIMMIITIRFDDVINDDDSSNIDNDIDDDSIGNLNDDDADVNGGNGDDDDDGAVYEY